VIDFSVIDSGGKDLEPVPFQVTCPGLCRLVPAIIPGTKMKNFHSPHPASRHGAADKMPLQGPTFMRTLLNYPTSI